MFFQEVAEAVSLNPKKSGREEVDRKIHRRVGNFRLVWNQSNEGKLTFEDDDGRQVVVTSTWRTPVINAYAEDNPETYKDYFKAVGREPL